MNCQECRTKWGPDVDEATLSHIAACDDCLRWVEARASEEEVLYMKDVPRPSPQLEERIMQAIYETAAHPSVPPLSAAGEGHARHLRPVPGLLRRSYLWAGAAGFVLAAGLIGLELLRTGHDASSMNRTGEQPAAMGSLEKAEAPEPAASSPQANAANEHTSSAVPDRQPAPANGSPQSASPSSPPPEPGAAGKSSAAQVENGDDPAKKSSTSALAAAPASGAQSHSAPARTPAAAPAARPSKPEPNGPSTETAAPAETSRQAEPAHTLTITDSRTALKTAAAPEEHPAAVQEEPPSITQANFPDVQSAVSASDLPVPEAAYLPPGFSLRSLSLVYESETSKAVTEISEVYRRDSDVISINVYRNDKAKRPLSIPGTFVERQLFLLDGNQAIGVTRPPAQPDAPAEHAVHVIVSKDSIPLYVEATAQGVNLEELISVVKHLQWKKS